MFLDYNQNAKDRTTCSAYSVRPLPDARVSTPLDWPEVPDCDPQDFTLFTIPRRFAKSGDPHADMDDVPGRLKSCWSSLRKMKRRASPTHPGRRTFARWKANPPEYCPRARSLAAKKPAVKKPLARHRG